MSRWLKWVGAAAALVLLMAAAGLFGRRAWQRSAGEREYAAAVAETERTDPDWRWNDLNATRRRPPAGKNSADVIDRIKTLTPGGWDAPLTSEKMHALAAVPVNARYPEELIAELRAAEARARPAFALARTLKDYPDGYREMHLAPDVISTVLDGAQHTRGAAYLLHWDVTLALESGTRDRAADDLFALLNTSRSIGDEPFAISQLVRIGTCGVAARATERVLAHTELTADRLAALQAAWSAEAEEPLLLYAARGERASFDVLMANVGNGTLPLESVTGNEPSSSVTAVYNRWSYRAHFYEDRARAHRQLTHFVNAARLTTDDQRAALDAIPPLPHDERLILSPAGDLTRTTLPDPCRRHATEARCVAVGLACERFRLEYGRWPNALTELPAALLSTVPLDPCDGKPLRYRRLPDGVVIYSVGRNLTDEDGRLTRPDSPDGTDDGFRLWDPSARRQPPPAVEVPEPVTPVP